MNTLVPGSHPAEAQGESIWAAGRMRLPMYSAMFLCSVATWLVAVRAPLWLDETGSYWQISGTAHDVWARRIETIAFPSYGYLLWAWARLFGTGEVVLRLLSVLAMAAALALFVCALRYVVDTDTSLLAGVILAVHPVISFAAIDVRPYACAALAISAALYVLFRYRTGVQPGPMIALGALAAAIISFQYLFGVFALSLLISLVLVHDGNRPELQKKVAIAAVSFVVFCLPMVSGILDLFRTSGTHVFEESPPLLLLILQFAPVWVGLTFLVALAQTRLTSAERNIPPARNRDLWLVSFALGPLPLLILFVISRLSHIHLFSARHCLIAIPGCAIVWALVVEKLFSIRSRVLFSLMLVSFVSLQRFGLRQSRQHSYTWKYALAVADGMARGRSEPLIICSDFPEADFAPMPLSDAKSSKLFAQLSYYRVAAPVVPFPRSLTPLAIKEGETFLQDSKTRHQDFVVLGYLHSFDTLQWFETHSATTHVSHFIGDFDGVRVVEFKSKR